MQLAGLSGYESLQYEPWTAQPAPGIDPKRSMFDTLSTGDVLPKASQRTEFDDPLMAHSSAVIVEVAGEPRFETDVARGLVLEMDWDRRVIDRRAVFSDDAERDAVVGLYREAIETLEARLPLFDRVRSKLTRWLRGVRDWLIWLF